MRVVKKIAMWLGIGFAGLVVLGLIIGDDEQTKPKLADANATTADAATPSTKTVRTTPEPTSEASPEPTPEPRTREEPDPDGSYDLSCDMVLGDFESVPHRFVAGGELENEGNVGIRVRVTYKWKQLGFPAVKTTKTYKVKAGKTREVNWSQEASSEEVDLYQAAYGADETCTVKGTIVSAFGQPPYED